MMHGICYVTMSKLVDFLINEESFAVIRNGVLYGLLS